MEEVLCRVPTNIIQNLVTRLTWCWRIIHTWTNVLKYVFFTALQVAFMLLLSVHVLSSWH
jgi:hypothetical protein